MRSRALSSLLSVYLLFFTIASIVIISIITLTLISIIIIISISRMRRKHDYDKTRAARPRALSVDPLTAK